MSRRRLLLVAYHFPPIQGSTGTNRTVAFSRYLQSHGWEVCVLTVRPSAYEDTSCDNESLLPSNVRVERAWAVDTRRSLSVFGRYPLALALPDRWQSWILGAFVKGSRIIRSWRPNAVMSTYPIPSAHVIGYLLTRGFRLPWIAEFRDPMLQANYPANSWERRAYAMIENVVFDNAAQVVVTTEGCRQMYLDRFPNFRREAITTISNGYDPAMFQEAVSVPPTDTPHKVVLLHSGLLYPHERNPAAFLDAVRSLSLSGFLDGLDVEFRFRASGNTRAYNTMVRELEIDKYVTFLPRISYQKALEEMRSADALMLFQADNCNSQIPAKVYEYFYCQRPILGLTDPQGETGKLLQRVGIRAIAKLEDRGRIEAELRSFLKELTSKSPFVVSIDHAKRFSRETLTSDLSDVLSRAVDSRLAK